MVSKAGCPYCSNASSALKKNNIPFELLPHDEHPDLVQAIKTEKSHSTFPMIFLDEKFIGGYSDLQKFLEKKQRSL